MSKKPKPLEIKISTVVAVSVILRTNDLALMNRSLLELTNGDKDHFEGELAVIDVGALEDGGAGLAWGDVIALLKSYQLNPVAARNPAPAALTGLLAYGLSIDNAPATRASAPASQDATPITVAAAPVPPALPAVAGPMIIDQPVRAGQRIYAQGTDLIVMAAVNNGAEIIADGNIHVYAPLRGRALAGASGNSKARIFALSMEAELVSIAGIYRTFANDLPSEVAKKPAQVRLTQEESIDVLPI